MSVREALDNLVRAVTALEARAIRSGGEFHVWAEERMVTEARDEALTVIEAEEGRAVPSLGDYSTPPLLQPCAHCGSAEHIQQYARTRLSECPDCDSEWAAHVAGMHHP